MAEALAVSRNTVTAAYDLLAAEGYLQPDRQGTRVTALARAPRAAAPRTVPVVADVAKRYLQPEKLNVIGVGDQAKIVPQLAPLKLAPVEYRDADGKLK